MRLGILGTGMIVKDLCRTIAKLNIEYISILGTENTREETEAMKEANNFDRTHYDYDEMLASDVDTIYVALPNHLHYIFSKKALEAGKHVIIEKPITSNAAELKELMAIAKEKELMIFEAMTIHHLPAFISMKEDLPKVGNLKIVNLNYSQYSSRYNAFKEGTILPAFDYTKSGGALMDINVYNVHAIIGMFGLPKSASYLANIERNIDTSGIMMYDYGHFKALSIGAKDCKAPIVCTFQGDLGTIMIERPVNGMTSYKIVYNNGEIEEKQFDTTTHRLYYEFVEFMRIMNEKDWKRHNELLEMSYGISELMETTRKAAGVIFTSDN